MVRDLPHLMIAISYRTIASIVILCLVFAGACRGGGRSTARAVSASGPAGTAGAPRIASAAQTQRPAGPAGWNLEDARGYWSVEVLIFDGSQHQEEGLELVKAMRQQHIEAYVYRGAAASGVYVGAWPRESVRVREEGGSGPTNAAMLLPLWPRGKSPDGLEEQRPQVQVIESRVQVMEESLRAVLKDYRRVVRPDSKTGLPVVHHSRLVMIPRPSGGE